MTDTYGPSANMVITAHDWCQIVDPSPEDQAEFLAWLAEQTGIADVGNHVLNFALDEGWLWCYLTITVGSAEFHDGGEPVRLGSGSIEFWRGWHTSYLPSSVARLCGHVLRNRVRNL